MNPVEQSAISKSVDTVSGQSKALIDGTSSPVDLLFPIVDHISQHLNFPKFLLQVEIFWIYMSIITHHILSELYTLFGYKRQWLSD